MDKYVILSLMKIKENYNLKDRNAFRIDVKARYFVEVTSEKNIVGIISNPKLKHLPKFILGNGSNTLFVKNFDGLVIKVAIVGRKIIKEKSDHILLEANAGENWHELVSFAVDNGWGGIENLALIPGTVGAAVVQNIAAYGENFSNVFYSLDAIDLETGVTKQFMPEECEFGYRNSVFKNNPKNKYLVIKVRLKLSKHPQIETSYYQVGISHDSIKQELKKFAVEPYTIKDIYNAVVSIRTKKLPNEKIVPNAGSFFLNPVISLAKYKELASEVSELQCYPKDQLYYKNLDDAFLKNENLVKVAAGRLLQEIGWLGKWKGNCGIHDKHALIIVANGKASGKEIFNFAQIVKRDFFNHYGIPLESEVQIV